MCYMSMWLLSYTDQSVRIRLSLLTLSGHHNAEHGEKAAIHLRTALIYMPRLLASTHLVLMLRMSHRMLLELSTATGPKRGKVQAGLLAEAPVAAGALPGATGTAVGVAAAA